MTKIKFHIFLNNFESKKIGKYLFYILKIALSLKNYI